jgi:SurA N-terminal domain
VFGVHPSYRLRLWCVAWTALLMFGWMLVATGDAQVPASAATCPPPSTLSSSTPTGPPSSANELSPAPEQIVACIGSQSITGAAFSHWAVVAQKSEGSSKHRLSASQVMKQAMTFLISSDWVLGEATDLNIHVSEGEVRHTFDHIRAQQFPKRKEFKAFLKQSGQTVADLLFRVRLNLASTRIQQHVAEGHRGARGQQHALSRFVHDFTAKWKAQTYCDPTYAVTDCGHVQASL